MLRSLPSASWKEFSDYNASLSPKNLEHSEVPNYLEALDFPSPNLPFHAPL